MTAASKKSAKTEKPKIERRGGPRPGSGRKKGVANLATQKAKEEANLTGETPLQYMLRVMRDPKATIERRDGMAKAAAPYIHAKLSSVEVGGAPDAAPIQFLMVGRLPKEKT